MTMGFRMEIPAFQHCWRTSTGSCLNSPAHLILLDLIFLIILDEEYKSRNFSLRAFLHFYSTSSLFGPDILLSTLFSNTLSLFSSLNVRDQVSHPYITIGKIVGLYILIFTFYDSRREDRRFWTEW
jgi:hypothetical protein